MMLVGVHRLLGCIYREIYKGAFAQDDSGSSYTLIICYMELTRPIDRQDRRLQFHAMHS